MFTTSTQKNRWIFADEAELNKLRENANRAFILRNMHKAKDKEPSQYFLNANEERLLVKSYESKMREFCRRFTPQMPKSVVGTAFHYLKRFYLKNSVMDYHPKEMLITCVYLACKVEEFNVSIKQFVANVKGDLEKATDIVLNNELLLMQQLNYELTIHNPYRPIEGLFIDLKVRSDLREPDRLRITIDDFLDTLFLTDACLLYSPAQIALAAILHSASKNQENLDAYVTETLLGQGNGMQYLNDLIEAVRKIRTLVKTLEAPGREAIKVIEKRLEVCRNEETNPDSDVYKRKMKEMLYDEDEREEMAASAQSTSSHEFDSMIQELPSVL
ncbi:cyclin-H [Planococcus citri]|uniref:cyclin-H n=1 Tax=Planococcus citri TaxID=170843 RepID=UPI0031F8C08D